MGQSDELYPVRRDGCLACRVHRLSCDGSAYRACTPCKIEAYPKCDWEGTIGVHVFKLFGPNVTEGFRFSSDPEGAKRTRVHGGSFGDIYKAQARDGMAVAVKVLRKYGGHDVAWDVREALLWSQLKHKNIHPLLGITFDCALDQDGREQIGFVSEFLDHGDVKTFLASPFAIPHKAALVKKLVRGLMDAVVYLHTEHKMRPEWVAHGDIKAANILVNEQYDAVLTDFGLSYTRMGNANDQINSIVHVVLDVRWLAPEYLKPLEFRLVNQSRNPESDVFSLGRTILEIYSGEVPFKREPLSLFRIAALLEEPADYRLPSRTALPTEAIERGLDDNIWAVLEQSWSWDPKNRPTAVNMRSQLRTIY